jgi:hypothetical protein
MLTTGDLLRRPLPLSLWEGDMEFSAVRDYAKSLYVLLGNRRRYPRLPASGTILATSRGGAITATHICSLVDISLHGMAVECSDGLSPDIFLDVQSEDHGSPRLARVRYCVPHAGMYRVGLEIVERPGREPSLM